MGAIYKVRHRLLDEIRVVKVIRSARGRPPARAGERFLREARAAIRLRHPNIAALHDFAIAEDGNAYIVMEFIDGLEPPGDSRRPRPAAARPDPGDRPPVAARPRLPPPPEDRPPRRLAGQPDADAGRGRPCARQADRPGDRQGLRGGRGRADHDRHVPGQAALRLARAVRRQGTRRAQRPLLVRHRPLRAAHRGVPDPGERSSVVHGRPSPPAAGRLAESDPEGRVSPALRDIVLRSLAKRPEERFADAEEFVGR